MDGGRCIVPEGFINTDQVAKILKVTQVAVIKMVREKRIPYINVEGEMLFNISDIEQCASSEVDENITTKEKEKKIIDYWMIPRSIRKLVSVQQMIREDYKNGVIGGQWRGARENHRERDKNLQKVGLRGESEDGFVDANPGGARTDVALLRALGFYAHDEEGNIELTYQGQQMIDSSNPAEIITEQLMQIRYPSPYSFSIKMDIEIQIYPYRFLFELLTCDELADDGSIENADGVIRITQKEIAQFVVPIAKKQSDIKKVIDMICENRISGENTKPSNLFNNIANTFINNIEITGYVERGKKSSVWIKPDKIMNVLERLESKPRKFKYEIGQEIEFQQRLGMDPTKTKFTNALVSNRKGAEQSVKNLIHEEFSNNPVTRKMVTDNLIEKLSRSAGTSDDIVLKVLDEILEKDPMDMFTKQYLTYSTGGRRFAREFEQTTTKIIEQLVGNAKWTGKEGKSPDITFQLLDKNGIIDCKAESKYNISNDHFNRMTVEDDGYIPAYNADFFLYIVHGFGTNFEKNLKRVEKKCNVRGAGIRAEDLIVLLKKSPISLERIHNLFTSSKVITIADINAL